MLAELTTSYGAWIREGAAFVFVVGAPRSGTTWVQGLLGGHCDVVTCPESSIFEEFLAPPVRNWMDRSDTRKLGLANYITRADFLALVRDVFFRVFADIIPDLKPGQFVVEKTPGNARYIPEILQVLPRAKFIHVLRDARDCVSSMLSASRTWGKDWAPSHPRDAALIWQRAVLCARDGMEKLSGDQCYEIRYEDLLTDTETQLRLLFDFLGLSSNASFITKTVSECSFEAAKSRGGFAGIERHGEMRQCEKGAAQEPEAFFRKGVVGGWKTDLNPVDKYFVWRYARKTMRKVGYPWSVPF